MKLIAWMPGAKDLQEYSGGQGTGRLLKKALSLQKGIPEGFIGDGHGIFGAILKNTILVAKGYKNNGEIVSVHRVEVFERAKAQGLQIVMYIESDNAFYVFDPGDIEKSPFWENTRMGASMINFNVKVNRRIIQNGRSEF